MILVRFQDIIIIFEGERVICDFKEWTEAVLDIYLNLNYCLLHVRYFKLILRHVYLEVFEFISDVLDLFLDVVFLMIELDIVVLLYVAHQALNSAFIFVHFRSQMIFFAKVHVSHFIKGLIVYFEEIFYLHLMLIQFIHHLLFLWDIRMFKLDYLFLNLLGHLCQNYVFVAAMISNAQFAIKSLIYATAVLNLLVLVFLTVKFARVVAEIT